MAPPDKSNSIVLDELKRLTNAQIDAMSDREIKRSLKNLRPTGLVGIDDRQIDSLNRSDAVALLTEARHDAQVRTN